MPSKSNPMMAGQPHDGKRLCGAMTRKGTPCERAPMPNGRCYKHGGATPSGAASPQFKTGRYSRVLPTRLLERYQEAVADPKRLEMEEEIGLLDARLADLLKRVDTGESGALWLKLRETWQTYRAALGVGDAEAQAACIGDIDSVLNRAGNDYAAWGEVRKVIQERRGLVESERKRQIEMRQLVSLDQFMVLVTAIGEAVRAHISDPTILAAIDANVRQLLGTPRQAQ